MKKISLTLEGLDCASCANKIEAKVKLLKEVKNVNLNFSFSSLTFEVEPDRADEIIETIRNIIIDLEPDVKVYEGKKRKAKVVSKCTDGSCELGDHEEHEEEHDDEHDHNHGDGKLFSIKRDWKLLFGIVLYVAGLIMGEESQYAFPTFLVAYLIVGINVLKIAAKNLTKGRVFDENFLMSIATLGAFFIGEYPEGVAVMIFYEIGEMFQGYAVNRSRKSISSLMDIKAETAVVLDEDGRENVIDTEEVEVGQIILIRPGERVPLDGIVVEGKSSIDTSALTGESLPRNIGIGEEILAGAINLNSIIKVKVEKEYGESTVARILDLVQNAASKKGKTEKFITKFSKYYTPIVFFSALALALIPPTIMSGQTYSDWIYRALVFLVVSCPCALVVSVPLGLFAGIGGASKKGVLVKGGNYLETLKHVETVVFDKTGTLTKGKFGVKKIDVKRGTRERVLEVGAALEQFSNHPIGKSIITEFGGESTIQVNNYEEISGRGLKGEIDGVTVLAGNEKLMKDYNINYEKCYAVGTIVYIAEGSELLGTIIIGDEIKEDSEEAIKELKALGVENIIMLTGDNEEVAKSVSNTLGLDKYYANLLPTDKVERVEQILQNSKGKVAFVGDGINDAPVLARVDIGIAMGGIGSDAAIEAADVVLMKDTPTSISDAIKISRKTMNIIWANIIFALGIKIMVLVLSAFGVATMWQAVFADVGVTIIAVLNSMRAMYVSK